jgi:hypothetical protein
MRRNAAANIWPGTRLPAMTARTVCGLASTLACTGAVRLSSVALLAAASRRACSMVSVPRASCAPRSRLLASSIPATCCQAEAISAVRCAWMTWVPVPASVRGRGSRLSPSSQPVPPGDTVGTPACQRP